MWVCFAVAFCALSSVECASSIHQEEISHDTAIGFGRSHAQRRVAYIGVSEHTRPPINATKTDDGRKISAAVASLPLPGLGLLSMLASFLKSIRGDVSVASLTGAMNGQLAKLVLGAALLAPSMPYIMKWKVSGHPPHPFLLSENAVDWPNWLHDIVQISAIVGLDLIVLAGLEWDWHQTIWYLMCFLGSMYGFIGFALFMYSVMSKKSPYSDDQFKSGKQQPTDEPINANSQYQDLTLSFVRVVVVVVVQSILIVMYAKEMVKVVPLTHQAYTYWALAVPIQIIARELMGRSFCAQLRLWNRLLHAQEGTHVQCGDDDSFKLIPVNYADVLLRSMMSYYANCLCMAMISFTLPVFMMSAASDIDFVKDCFAIVFITTLDDLSETLPMKMRSGVELP